MTRTGHAIVSLCLTLVVAACAPSTDVTAEDDPELEKMHINASLSFALALPASWQKVDEEKDGADAAAPSPRWRTGGENAAGQPEAVLRVVSRPPESARGGFDSLEKQFFARRPAVEKLSGDSTTVDGYPARRLVGRVADRRLLVVFVTTSRRAFTLEFTTDADLFEAYRPLFKEILLSFQVL